MRHRILRDFEIQTDYQILTRKPNLVIINKRERERVRERERICCIVDFAIPADHMIYKINIMKRKRYINS